MNERPERLIDTVAKQNDQLREQGRLIETLRAETASIQRSQRLYRDVELATRLLQQTHEHSAECTVCDTEICETHGQAFAAAWQNVNETLAALDNYRKRQASLLG